MGFQFIRESILFGLFAILPISEAFSQEFNIHDRGTRSFTKQKDGPRSVKADFEYLIWWVSAANCPPLLTTSDDTSTRAQAGTLDNPSVQVLFGGSVDGGDRPGGRVNLFKPMTDTNGIYFTGTYLADDRQSGDLFASSAGLPILARPFTDATSGLPNSELVAFPSVLSGSIVIDNYSETYISDIGLVTTMSSSRNGELFLRSGYRFLSFRDELSVGEDLTSIELGGTTPLNTQFVVRDSFEAVNVFHGGSLGLGVDMVLEDWTYLLTADVALGTIARRLTIDGQTDVTVPSLITETSVGGLLSQPTNIGTYRSQSFAAIPEFNAKVRRTITENFSVTFGYTFLLIPQIARASEQIDFLVNQSQIGGNALVGPSRPAYSPAKRDMWMQGISFGTTIRF